MDAPAVNLLVRFSYLSFGAGTIRNFIGETFVDVPVKGATGLPAAAKHVWTTPAVPGHYCIQVELVWPDDANPDNNLGQENVNVQKLNSPNATFEFALRNDSGFAAASTSGRTRINCPGSRHAPIRNTSKRIRAVAETLTPCTGVVYTPCPRVGSFYSRLRTRSCSGLKKNGR